MMLDTFTKNIICFSVSSFLDDFVGINIRHLIMNSLFSYGLSEFCISYYFVCRGCKLLVSSGFIPQKKFLSTEKKILCFFLFLNIIFHFYFWFFFSLFVMFFFIFDLRFIFFFFSQAPPVFLYFPIFHLLFCFEYQFFCKILTYLIFLLLFALPNYILGIFLDCYLFFSFYLYRYI